MKDKIEIDLLDKLRKTYKGNKNIGLQHKFKSQQFCDVLVNSAIKKENKFEFNLELEDVKIYNQGTSKRCWMFGILNLIKNDMAHNLHQSALDFELSPNYLNFYDKLEKANHAYQVVIDLENPPKDFQLCDYENHPLLTGYFKEPVRENGKLVFARSLLKKYGIVPMNAMPETYNSINSDDFNTWFTRKVRHDMLKLLSLKKVHKNLYLAKEKMLEECYTLLANVLGEPPKTFIYTYVDENGQKKALKNLSPIDFYNKYCSINLDDFELIAQMPVFENYKLYERRYSKNIVEADAHHFVSVPQNEFTKSCISQLKAGLPVVIGCDNRKYHDKERKILDTRIFDFENLLDIKNLNKKEALETFDCRSRHYMTIRGAHLIDEKPIRWKVEDSAGKESRIGGYYVMNNNYFEKCVFYAWIKKKFLSKKVLQAFKQKPILYGFEGGEL